MRLVKKLRRGMLTVPLPVELGIAQPEVRREVHDQTGPSLDQLSHRLRALAVPIGDKGHVEVGGFYLFGRDVRSLDGKLRIDAADP